MAIRQSLLLSPQFIDFSLLTLDLVIDGCYLFKILILGHVPLAQVVAGCLQVLYGLDLLIDALCLRTILHGILNRRGNSFNLIDFIQLLFGRFLSLRRLSPYVSILFFFFCYLRICF